MPAPQNLKSHTRWNPPFHFFVLPLTLINFILAIYITIHRWPEERLLHIWWIVMAVVLFVIAGLSREGALKAQDRVIRLEERLRLASLLPASEHGKIDQLSTSQLIGLRFASDGEVAALALKAVSQGLDQKAIKQNIVNWRADYQRV